MTSVKLHTLTWNPDGQRSGLLLHGVGSDAATLWRLASALAEAGLRVVAPDLRGHGASPPTNDYTLAAYAGDVALLGESWDLVAGHSLGGSILAELLCAEGFARRAVLIDPVLVLPDERAPDLVAAQVAEVGGRATVAGVLDTNPAWDREDVLRKVGAAARVTDRVVRETFERNLPWDLRDRIARWSGKVHVLVAGEEPLIGPGALAALAPHDVTIVSAAGHSIHRDQPEIVVDALLAALDDGRPA